MILKEVSERLEVIKNNPNTELTEEILTEINDIRTFLCDLPTDENTVLVSETWALSNSILNIKEKMFSTHERKKMAETGEAESDGSFPIKDSEDVFNAVQAYGRSKDPTKTKAHIIKRAKALGCEYALPQDWHMSHIADSVKESVLELMESKTPEGSEWDVIFIQKGMSLNRKLYTETALKEAAPLFEGVGAFSDHISSTEQIQRPERSIRDKVGVFRDVKYGTATIGNRTVEGLHGRFKVIDPKVRELLLESVRLNEPNFIGFSIDAIANTTEQKDSIGAYRQVEKFIRVNSVDVVTTPGAGGEIIRLVASATPVQVAENNKNNKEVTMTPEEISALVAAQVAEKLKEANADTSVKTQLEALIETNRVNDNKNRITGIANAATGLSDLGKKKVIEKLTEAAGRRTLTDTEIVSDVADQVAYEAAVAGRFNTNYGMSFGQKVQVGLSTPEYYDLAIAGMFEAEDQVTKAGVTVNRFKSIKEAYCRWTGEDPFGLNPMAIVRAFNTKYDSGLDHSRIRESVNLTQWGDIYADNLYIQMLKAYSNGDYNNWPAVVSEIQDVPDFQTQHWARVGGYADLAAVSESATYPLLTSPTDEAVSYAIAKKGGIDDITFEAITDDRFGAIRKIPQAMGRSAARTLYKFVMSLATDTNPTMSYDSVALYNSAHGSNTATTALSVAGVAAGVLVMRSQTAYNESSEILGSLNKPKIMIVNNALEYRARRILNPSDTYAYGLNTTGNTDADTSVDPQAFKNSMDLMVYDQLTGTTSWYMVADPKQVNTMVIGFLNGQRTPELYVQDQATVGGNFTADKVSYKVRHIYGGVVSEHRSFYRGNV